MKQLIMTALITITVISSAFAQNRVSIGIEGATLATGMINQNPYGFNKLPVNKTSGSFQAITIAYQLNSNLSLQSGVQYINMGQNYLYLADEDLFNNRNITLKYVQLPIAIQNQLGEGALKFISGAGFSYSRLVSSEFEENIDTTLGEGENTMLRTMETNSDRFNKNQFSGNAFVGVLLQVSDRINVKATALGNLGLTDVNANEFKYEDAWENPYKKTRNINVGFSAGLQFKL